MSGAVWEAQDLSPLFNTGFMQVSYGLHYGSFDLGDLATTKFKVIVGKFEPKLGPTPRTILHEPAERVQKTELRYFIKVK